MNEVEVLRRAHELFAQTPASPSLDVPLDARRPALHSGATNDGYQRASADRWADVLAAREVDTRLIRLLSAAAGDHAEARRSTAAVLAAAQADASTAHDNPIAARELLRRRVARLRAQHRNVGVAHTRVRHHHAALNSLRYRRRGRRRPAGQARVAVRAALSRLGKPYVWGATGPDRFDCSGLVQWAYSQAGIRLHRTTFEQIHDGVPVARADVRPGDLVFPHAGHVQLAIGGGLVVEAPQPGATVQISRMGSSVAIRRPV